jgi:cell division protein FtsQ
LNRNKALLILSVLILTFSGSYILASHSSHFCVSEVTIRGNHKIPSEEIMEVAGCCVGSNILSLDLERVEEELMQDSRIKGIRIRRRLPRAILVEVEEKVPVLWMKLPAGLIASGNCGLHGLSTDQEIIPLAHEDLTFDLPIVTGIEIKPGKGKTERSPDLYQKWSNIKAQKALEFYKSIKAVDPSSTELIAEINLKDMSNITVYLLPGIKVMMGQGDFETKWRRLKTILEGEEFEDLVCVDLRFEDQVVLAR